MLVLAVVRHIIDKTANSFFSSIGEIIQKMYTLLYLTVAMMQRCHSTVCTVNLLIFEKIQVGMG